MKASPNHPSPRQTLANQKLSVQSAGAPDSPSFTKDQAKSVDPSVDPSIDPNIVVEKMIDRDIFNITKLEASVKDGDSATIWILIFSVVSLTVLFMKFCSVFCKTRYVARADRFIKTLWVEPGKALRVLLTPANVVLRYVVVPYYGVMRLLGVMTRLCGCKSLSGRIKSHLNNVDRFILKEDPCLNAGATDMRREITEILTVVREVMNDPSVKNKDDIEANAKGSNEIEMTGEETAV